MVCIFFSLVKDENKFDFKKIISDNWIEPPKRERKINYSKSEYFKQTMRQSGPARPKEPRIPRMSQFTSKETSERYDRNVGDPLTVEEQKEKERLLEEGFSTWSLKDFNSFIRPCEKYDRHDIKGIASEIEGETEEEVERYANVFRS
ncbi:hypothetical protein ACS0TY_006116 [Phlomoides rotata]